MYTAKSHGKGRYEVFEPGMHSAVLNRLQFKADLQRAFDHDEFVLYFQPIISVDDEADDRRGSVGSLAQPRTRRRPAGRLHPAVRGDRPHPAARRWVLDDALAQATRWSFAERSLTMSVNLSAMQLQQPGSPPRSPTALAAAGVPARCSRWSSPRPC